eukprot:GABV01000267.1.p1 GENE.GABV01000267.1~~GABV01000267.1.p1  ORF type:complete len:221 (+),score=106.79 GABV01000267.1:349-1011(+)
MPPRWMNFYGAPIGCQKGYASSMNRGYVPGSFYRGRALVAVDIADEDEPKAEAVDVGGLDPELRPKEEAWILQFDLYEGSEIVEFDALDNISGALKGNLNTTKEMHVELHVGAFIATSSKQAVKNGRCFWNEGVGPKKGETDIRLVLPSDVSQCPDVMIYLCRGKDRVSFKRIPFETVIEDGWLTPPRWVRLQEDKATDRLDEDVFPGSLLFAVRGGKAF